MAISKKAAAERKAQLLNDLKMKRLKASLASRKTNYKKAALAAGVSYTDHVLSVCGISIAEFEDVNWSLPKRAAGGTAPDKNTPEWKEYKSVASRKTYMKSVMECAECVDPEMTSITKFVEKYTEADNVEQFLSTEWLNERGADEKRLHNSPYTVRGYKFLEEFH